MQLGFKFKNDKPEILIKEDGDALYYKYFFNLEESETFLNKLYKETDWKEEEIKMFGNKVKIPRLTAWYGDPNSNYAYSGIKMNPNPWTDTLKEIKKRIEDKSKISFNSVLLNLYRDGNDSISWHSDNEPELGKEPIVGSVSFGEVRKFHLKHKTKNIETIRIDLDNGSFLLMKGKTQQYWKHQIPKTTKKLNHRINLTFRVIQ